MTNRIKRRKRKRRREKNGETIPDVPREYEWLNGWFYTGIVWLTTVISNLILIKKEDQRRINGKIDNNFSNGRYFSNDRYFNRDMEIAISRNCCNSNGSFDLVEIVIFFFLLLSSNKYLTVYLYLFTNTLFQNDETGDGEERHSKYFF